MNRYPGKLHVRLTLLLIVVFGTASTGCRLCCETDDHTFSAYGGAWERTNRDSGRVGSLFDPAGAKASSLVDRDAPSSPDELERERRKDDPDPYSLEPDKAAGDEGDQESESESEMDEEQRKRIEELKNQGLEDINVEPGELVPPLLY